MSTMHGSLQGKRVLVTGAGKRLGRGIALALASEGMHLVAHYHRSASEAMELAEEARALGVDSVILEADLADAGQAAGLVDRAWELAGPLDYVVNNASIFPRDTLETMESPAVMENVQINALSPFAVARAFARRGGGGAVVNLLDSRMTQPDLTHAAYHLSKRMLLTLTRMMALEFAPAVRVNAVAPGLILPPPGEGDAFLQRLAERVPLRRWGTPRGVAEAVLYLLRAEFVTGQVIYVDGGMHVKGSPYAE